MSDEKQQQEPKPEPPPKKKEHWWKRLGREVEQDAGNAIGEAFANRQ